MFVADIIRDIRAKHNYGEGGLDHGLLFKEQGLWLSPNKMLGHYDFKFGDVLEFRKKHRILKVKTLDANVKNILVDESTSIKSIVEVICQRIGLANPEEYSLMKEEKEEVNPKKEKKKAKEIKTDARM
jgi:talin